MTAMDLTRLMEGKHNIRNIAVIGASSHGKTTLIKSFAGSDGFEENPGLTTKLAGVSLCYNLDESDLIKFEEEHYGTDYLINVVDSPGHSDLSAEVNAALRLTDGTLLVVDYDTGVSLETETVLSLALEENHCPILVINKIDLCFELLNGEQAYKKFKEILSDVNDILDRHTDHNLGSLKFCPENGNVGFSSGLQGWAFSLANFAKRERLVTNTSEEMNGLWGVDTFVDTIYDPLRLMIADCMNNNMQNLKDRLKTFGVTYYDDKQLRGKELAKDVMQLCLPAAKALMNMMISHLPSPHKAQKTRCENLYPVDKDDQYANAIKACDPSGPLVVFVAKMVPCDPDGFMALGRVYSGTVSTGMEVRMMGSTYIKGQEQDAYEKRVVKTVVWEGSNYATVQNVPCGNIVAMVGLDDLIIPKTTTLTSKDVIDAHPMRPMKYKVSPVVRVQVKCRNPSDLYKLREGLSFLAKSDLLVVCTIESRSAHIIAGAGEFHIEVCLNELKEKFISDYQIEVSKPFISCRETVLEDYIDHATCWSQNKYNKLLMEAGRLTDEDVKAIQKGEKGPGDRVRVGVERQNAKILYSQVETTGINVLTNMCSCPSHVNAIKDSLVMGFQWATEKGVLADEKMRSICFNICNGTIISPHAKWRGPAQIAPAAMDAVLKAQKLAKPGIFEPFYLVAVYSPAERRNEICSELERRRGEYVNSTERNVGVCIKLYLPVSESFGLSDVLKTYGASYQSVFHTWCLMTSDSKAHSSEAGNLVKTIRMMKDLK